MGSPQTKMSIKFACEPLAMWLRSDEIHHACLLIGLMGEVSPGRKLRVISNKFKDQVLHFVCKRLVQRTWLPQHLTGWRRCSQEMLKACRRCCSVLQHTARLMRQRAKGEKAEHTSITSCST